MLSVWRVRPVHVLCTRSAWPWGQACALIQQPEAPGVLAGGSVSVATEFGQRRMHPQWAARRASTLPAGLTEPLRCLGCVPRVPAPDPFRHLLCQGSF